VSDTESTRGGTEELDVRLLGHFEVRVDGNVLALGGPRQRAVLAILAVAANEPVSLDALADRLWAGEPPPSATATLHAYVSSLRKQLEPHRVPRSSSRVLVSRPNGYALVLPELARDVDRVEAQLAAAQRLLDEGDPSGSARAARDALTEWRGPVLADFVDEPFAEPEIRRWEEIRLQVTELLMEAELAAGRHGAVVAQLDRLVAAHPLRERLRGQLMLALYRSGRQAKALEIARIGRKILADELGLDPDPALRELEGAILRQDPALTSTTREPPPPALPPSRIAGDDVSGPAMASARLVGRTEEREVLDRALEAASAHLGRVVLIGGEPGIGKTRLAEAFSEVAGSRVVWGWCQDTEGSPPFWPWRQIVRDVAGELEDGRLLSALGADAGVVADVVPEIAARIDVASAPRPADAQAARFHFFDAVTRLLVDTAAERPLVVVLEDLHWADESSLALLRFVTSAVRRSGILLIATYRSVAVSDRALLAQTLGALVREPVVERLLLPSLDRDDAAALVSDVLGHAPTDELVDQILARTDGNPLFTIHLARLLRPVLTRPEEMDSIVRNHVPPAMADLIELRVSALDAPARHLLEVASIVGRDFDLRLLVRVHPVSFEDALVAMDEAIAAGLVVEADTPGSYSFTHALMREAIVAGLGRARSARLHGLVGDARAVSGLDAESLPAVAHHYWEASSVGWSTAALESNTAAAVAAISRFAYEEAERHLDRALKLLHDLPDSSDRDRAELEVRMQAAFHAMRSRGYAVTEVGLACQRARELATRTSSPERWLIASWGLAAHHLVRGEHAAAMTIGQSLLETGRADGAVVAEVAGHMTTGIPLLYLARPAEAAGHLRRAIALIDAAAPGAFDGFPQDLRSGATAFLAWAEWALGDDAVAEDHLREALAIATARGGYDEVFIRMVSAQLGILRRSVSQVIDDTARMLEVCGQVAFRHLAAHARVMRGWALAQSGQQNAVSLIDEGLAYFAAHENSVRLVHNLTLRAEALAATGRMDDAAQATADALAASLTSEECFYQPQLQLMHERLARPDVDG
jgi:DNA-binding SARP family transcriptional activator/tetratricopeptide (TPR) repeat protein